MADSYSITDLITRHQRRLNFSWLGKARPAPLHTSATQDYWIGEYTPDQVHAIEIIAHPQLPLIERLLTAPPSSTDNEATAPQLLIYCEQASCPPQLLARLQAQGIAVGHSPLPAKTILRELAYDLAQDGQQHTQHGVMLSIHDHGVLLRGASGIGKSGIALELIARGHRLVCDDAPLLHRLPASQQVYALCPPLLADLLEVRALGILNVCRLYGPMASTALMPVQLVIQLVSDFSATAEQRLQPFSERTSILDVDIPISYLPIHHVTNPAVLVETVSKNHILYSEGYDAGVILAQQQRQQLHHRPV